MKHLFEIQYGSIYNTQTGSIVENPAVLINEDGIAFGFGDEKDMLPKYKSMALPMRKIGDCLNMLTLSPFNADRQMQCYILNRVAEFSGHDFNRQLIEMASDKNKFLPWIEQEMQKVPIEELETEFDF